MSDPAANPVVPAPAAKPRAVPKKLVAKAKRLIAVGGVDADGFAGMRQAGCSGFGIGSAIYKPGMGADEVRRQADRMVRAAAG